MQGQALRRGRQPSIPLIITLALFLFSLPASAQEGSGPGDGDSDVNPDALADFQTRVYKIRKKKLWKGLLGALEKVGYPPEEIDEKARNVVTSFVDFEAIDFEGDVAEPPLRLGPKQHVIQLKEVRAGKLSLKAIIETGEGGTALKLRARILVMGIDRRQKIRVLVDRRSTGVIEAAFYDFLQEALGIEPL